MPLGLELNGRQTPLGPAILKSTSHKGLYAIPFVRTRNHRKLIFWMEGKLPKTIIMFLSTFVVIEKF